MVLGSLLDLIILEAFSNLNDSMLRNILFMSQLHAPSFACPITRGRHISRVTV